MKNAEINRIDVVRSVDFSNRVAGVYTREEFRQDWKINPTNSSGCIPGPDNNYQDTRLHIEQAPDGSGTALRVTYLANSVGGSSAMVFQAPLYDALGGQTPGDAPYTLARMIFEVMFPDDFTFVRGGKLPGLASFDKPTGCIDNTDFSGFSARSMWHYRYPDVPMDSPEQQYVLDSYLYNPLKEERCGDYFMQCESPDGQVNPPLGPVNGICSLPVLVQRNVWYRLEQFVSLSNFAAEVPQSDGFVRQLVDDELRLSLTGLQLRKTPDVYITSIAMETFFGGSTLDWAPATPQHAYFRSFVVEAEARRSAPRHDHT